MERVSFNIHWYLIELLEDSTQNEGNIKQRFL